MRWSRMKIIMTEAVHCLHWHLWMNCTCSQVDNLIENSSSFSFLLKLSLSLSRRTESLYSVSWQREQYCTTKYHESERRRHITVEEAILCWEREWIVRDERHTIEVMKGKEDMNTPWKQREREIRSFSSEKEDCNNNFGCNRFNIIPSTNTCFLILSCQGEKDSSPWYILLHEISCLDSFFSSRLESWCRLRLQQEHHGSLTVLCCSLSFRSVCKAFYMLHCRVTFITIRVSRREKRGRGIIIIQEKKIYRKKTELKSTKRRTKRFSASELDARKSRQRIVSCIGSVWLVSFSRSREDSQAGKECVPPAVLASHSWLLRKRDLFWSFIDSGIARKTRKPVKTGSTWSNK